MKSKCQTLGFEFKIPKWIPNLEAEPVSTTNKLYSDWHIQERNAPLFHEQDKKHNGNSVSASANQ